MSHTSAKSHVARLWALPLLLMAACGSSPAPEEHSFAIMTDCASCHLDQWQASLQPPHEQLGLPTACSDCHTTGKWPGASFDIHDQFFVLDGQHAALDCTDCHTGGNYTGTSADCYACHTKAYEGADGHVSRGYPHACATCHKTSGWEPPTWKGHDGIWPLTGKHTNAKCSSCHQNDVFEGTPTACAGCHLPDFQGAKDPDHVAEGFPQTCEVCHTTKAWEPASFEGHDQVWPLVGKHTTTACASCHVGGVYEGTPRECEGCHLPDYQGTKDPDHAAAGYPTTCQVCHTANAWEPASFAGHDAYWPLTGKHKTAACTTCHEGGVYAGTPKECKGCHLSDFQGTKDPDHVAEGFPQTCDACHTTTAWEPANFEGHDAFWPLVGKHEATPCASCHVGGVYAGTPKECKGCHLPDYQGTKDPDHAAAGYPTSCQVCHTPSAWEPATFTGHDSYWPLTGKHQTAACSTCHAGGVYAGTPKECKGCHLPDFQGAKDPDHVASGFPQTCDACHTTKAWEPATFTDHDSYWPLTGKHKTAACTTCHAGGVYAGTAKTCQGCHTPDWTGAANPSHAKLALPKTCDTCHTTSNWDTNTFPGHNALFPITSGKHAFTCNKCHKAATWDVFTCIDCHTLSKMNSEHQGEVGNYQSTLNAAKTIDHGCLKCHPDGTKND